jgi:gluconate kinase
MPAALLASQLAALEPLGSDEAAAVFDFSGSAEAVAEAVAAFSRSTCGRDERR